MRSEPSASRDSAFNGWLMDRKRIDSTSVTAKLVTERKSSNAAGSFDARVHDLKRTLVERASVDAAGDFEVAAATLGLSASYPRRLVRSLNVKLP